MARRHWAFTVLLAVLLSGLGALQVPYTVQVDVPARMLYVWQGEKLVRQYPVAVGTGDTPSPVGVFRIVSRFRTQPGSFGTCFLGLDVPWGQYGIHGTNKPEFIGHAASHGCIRLNTRDAEELYRLLPNGTLVVIENDPYGGLGWSLPVLHDGDRSTAVLAVQRRLRSLGLYALWPDGVYGPATRRAVDHAKNLHGLPPGDVIDHAFYRAIGLSLFE